MFIKAITLKGKPDDVTLAHAFGAVLVTAGNRIICEVRRDHDHQARLAKAAQVVNELSDNGTVQEVLDAIQRVGRF